MLDLFLLLLLDAVVECLVLLDLLLKRVLEATVLLFFWQSLGRCLLGGSEELHSLLSRFALLLFVRFASCSESSLLLEFYVFRFMRFAVFFRILTVWTELCLCLKLCYGWACRCHLALHFDQLDFVSDLLFVELFLLSGNFFLIFILQLVVECLCVYQLLFEGFFSHFFCFYIKKLQLVGDIHLKFVSFEHSPKKAVFFLAAYISSSSCSFSNLSFASFPYIEEADFIL